MKRFFTFCLLSNLFLCRPATAQVSVTATGGTTGPTTYTDFVSAFTAINGGTHTGTITVSVTANFSQSAVAVLNASGSGSASYTAITIKPAASTNPVVTNTADNAASPCIKLNGADNVTIDGSNNGTTSRNLTFQNSNSSGSGQSCNIWIASNGTDGATNNVIKNCKVLGSSYSLGAPYMGACIYSSTGSSLIGYWLSTSLTTGANNNNLIQNNLLNGANAGVVFNGGASIGETGNQVTGNTIGDITSGTAYKFTNTGVFLLNQANFTIDNNTITWMNATNTNVVPGAVSIGAGCTNGTISRNVISNIRFTTTTIEGGIVLNSSASSNIKVINNFVFDVASTGSTTVASNAYGIVANAGSGYNIQFNSVNMNTNPTTTANGYQAALYIGSATGLNVRNNLLIHSGSNTTNKFSVYATSANPTSSVIDYNDYYTTASVLAYAGANQTALTDVQTNLQATLTHSKNVSPTFVSATDLHLVTTNASNIANLAGAGVAITGITADIDGNTRAAAPTIGAHEITAATCPAPTSPTVSNITTTTAQLNWTQTGTPAQWQIKYGAAGFNVNTGGTTIYTNTKPYTLNPPLAVSTSYDYYVRAVCGAGDTSAWSAVTNFTTLCNAPSIVSKKDSFNCGPGAVTLEATTTSGASIKWYAALTGGTALATGNSYTTASLTATTNYYITAISGTCESSPRQMVTASIRPIPTVNLGRDTSICPGVSYTFDAGNAGGTYLWSTGATTQTITTNAAGQYYVKVTVQQCSKNDTILITPGIAPVNVMPAVTNLCAGDVATLNAGNAGSTFVWSPGGATTQTITANTGGTYSVNIKSADGCRITSSTNLIIRPLPVDNLAADTSICEGAGITLDAGNTGYTFLWNTGATTQTINVTDSGNYIVTITTPYNCVNEDTQHVAFLPSPRTEGFNFIPMFFDQLGKVQFFPLNPTDVLSYEWDFGDGSPIVTQMNPVHTYASMGHFNVTLKVYNNCTDFSQSQEINIDLPTGIGTVSGSEAAISVYPNPAKEVLSIAGNNTAFRMKEITVFNALGAVVYQAQADAPGRHEISVRGFANGLYYLRILTDKGFVNQQFQVVK